MRRKFTLIKVLLTFIIALVVTGLQAQTTKVTGRVLAEKDQSALPGVTVSVKGKNVRTQTDGNGAFSVSATPDDVLVFTSVGYVPVEVAAGSSGLTVRMKEDAAKLNEVVVIGYGEQSRRTVTGTISKLDNKVLETAPRSNVGTALQGTIAGLSVVPSSGTPGASPTILLRGGASINSPSAPLVVVDGVIRAYNDIAPEDVASIDVLKDASVTAVYGARANNGVILITTKKGKAGTAEFSYTFKGGYNKQRENYQYLNARDYIYYTRLGNINSGRSLAAINASRGYGLSTNPADLNSFDIRLETAANIDLLQQGWQDMDDPANPGSKIIFKDHSDEIRNLIFRNTYTQDHYVSGSGGNEKGRYFASLNYYNEGGIIMGSSYKRYTGNFSGSYKLRPNLEMSTSTILSTSSQLGVLGGSEISTLYRNQALWPTFNPWLDANKTVPNPGNSITDGNPLYWLDKLQRSNENDRVTVTAALKWNATKELSFQISGSGYLTQVINQSFQKATQTYANLLNNTFSSTSRDAVQSYNRSFQQTYDLTANYNKTIGKHVLSGQLLGEYLDNKALVFQVYGQNAATDNIPTPNASTTFAIGNNTGSRAGNRIISSLARISYVFDDRYILNAVVREDGVSQLASQRRIGFFPGVSVGWNLHNEEFYKNSGISKVISTVKPRASYGSNGNISGLGNYDVQGVYSLTTAYNGNGAFVNSTPTNFNLIWERSSSVDVGLDLGLFNDRISLLFDRYDRRNNDLITNLQLPNYTGFGSLQTNLGSYQNVGYEFTLKANLINQPNGLRVDMGINASTVKNKVLKLPYNGNDNNRIGGLQVYDPTLGQVVWVSGTQEGQPLGAVYGYKQVSIFKDAAEVAAVAGNRVDNVAGITGPNLPAGPGGRITPGDVNWLDVNGDNIIDSRDQVYLGNIFPKWIGGFNFSASYKGISAYTRFEFNTGNIIYNDFLARTDGQYQGTFNLTTRVLNSWSPTNINTDVPKVYYADQVVGSKQNYTRGNNGSQVLNSNNSSLYESGSYLACREITVSYDLPKKVLGYTKLLTRSRLFFNANNLFYIKKFSGAAPESTNGLYAGTYPVPKSFVVGIQASF